MTLAAPFLVQPMPRQFMAGMPATPNVRVCGRPVERFSAEKVVPMYDAFYESVLGDTNGNRRNFAVRRLALRFRRAGTEHQNVRSMPSVNPLPQRMSA